MPTRRFSRRHKSTWRSMFGFLKNKKLIPWILTLAGVFFLCSAGTVLWWSKDLPDPQNINQSQVQESTKIFDSTGKNLLYEIGDAKRTYVPLDQISSYITQATLAAEDDKFYEHHGIVVTGILRGTILKPLAGQRAQGGSTITQQLIKNSILSPERTLQRKVKEAVLALELEQRFTKNQILEMYLNGIPYGSRSYGIEAAAQTFFGTSAKNTTLAQATILAALPQAPTYFSPYGSHMEDLKARQEYILDRMVSLNMITKDQADQAKAENLEFQPAAENIKAPHFVFYVKEQLEKQYGERIVDQGGLNVITTLDIRMQNIAEETLKKQQENLKRLGASNAALVAINPKNGDILSMAGSIDYFNKDIDGNVNVAIRHRSPGSSIKPFVYAAAFEKGYTPDTVLVDAETDFGQGYTPKNYDLSTHGPVSMRQALAGSLNIPAVKTLYLVGVKEATKLAQAMGMESLSDPDRYGLSLVLGGGEVRLLDETSAYGVFANDGVRYPARSILKVQNKDEVLYDAEKETVQPTQPISSQAARLLTSVISDNSARAYVFGGNSPLQLGSRPVAAKTGTAQDFRDGWTIGFTPSLVAGVWTGNNDNSPMKTRSDAVVTAGPIWNAFMRQALEGTPIEQFVKPEPDNNLTNSRLRGEIPEVKGKWVSETNTLYTLDCPVDIGVPRTFKELHSVLFYVRKDAPNGPPPSEAEADPQFDNWEKGIRAWLEKHNTEKKDDPNEPLYADSLPIPSCNIGNEEDIPKVRIAEPDTTILKNSPTTVKAEIDTNRPIKEVRFILDGKEIAKRGPDDPFVANISFGANETGRKALVILAITDNNLIGQAHRTFIINPDDSAPSITLHTPTNNTNLKANNFPQTLKATSTDASGIDYVDFLVQKDGESGTKRIGKTSELAPTAPNRYEVIWKDSPGPGTYYIYAIAYDKTGNFKETDRRTVTIE